MTQGFRLVRAKNTLRPVRGGSLVVLLEPRCSKWREAYKLLNGELFDPLLRGRLSPFISQGGVLIYIFLPCILDQVEVLRLGRSAGYIPPVGNGGVGPG